MDQDKEKIMYFIQSTYKQANKAVAELCNHKKAVSKNHGQVMANAQNRVNALKVKVNVLEKELVLRKKILKIISGKLPPKTDSDLKEETLDGHQVKGEPELKVKAEPELKVKVDPEVKNEMEKSDEEDSKVTVEREDIKKESKVDVKEETTNAAEEEEIVTVADLKKTSIKGMKEREEKCKKLLKKAMDAVEKAESNVAEKEDMKEIALGTSRLNYLDPRITVQWCTTHGVPLEKVCFAPFFIKQFFFPSCTARLRG